MRTCISLLVLVVSLFVSANLQAELAPSSSIDFYKGTLEEAQKKAADEGRLFFVDFYAKWCAPCKWMDETTFSDTRVTNMLNQNFVSLKVDIDEFEGFSLKQEYKVKYLPTILIFNSKGELIERVEETLSPRKMLAILEKHNAKNPTRPNVSKLNTSPSSPKIKNEPIAYAPRPEIKAPAHSGNYRVQVGTYSDFKNTFKYVNELKETFAEPIIVLNDYNEGKIVYKIMIGEFNDEGLANDFARILNSEFGISGIVK